MSPLESRLMGKRAKNVLRESLMKKLVKNLVFYSFLSILLSHSLSASIPTNGSPDRCKDKPEGMVILPVDNLLPEDYTKDIRASVESFKQITPERMLQSVVDHLLTFNDLCEQSVAGVGGWEDGIGTALCDRLYAYDLSHDGALSENSTKASPDLNFLKTVFKACRISTFRFWNGPLITHVSYQPTPEESDAINKIMKDVNGWVSKQP